MAQRPFIMPRPGLLLRLGIVADSHGLSDPGLPRLLAGVAGVLHAGDVVEPRVLEDLGRIAPVIAVRGNNDDDPEFRDLPVTTLVRHAGVRILMRHIAGRPDKPDPAVRRALRRHHPHALVLGHSHQVLAKVHEGVAWLNPGSCGPRRFRLPRSAGVLEIAVGGARFVVTDLDDGSELARLEWAPEEQPPEEQPPAGQEP